MPRASNWIDLHEAARRLSELWSIPPTLAEELVHNAVESNATRSCTRAIRHAQLLRLRLTSWRLPAAASTMCGTISTPLSKPTRSRKSARRT